MESLRNKPEGQSDDKSKDQSDEDKAKDNKDLQVTPKSQKDPFIPPFEEGQYIEELTDTHRLIYNKYSVSDEHVIVITKEYEEQSAPLSVDDFKAALITCKALDAFMFFNCGFKSGASIPHRHLQVIPYESMYQKLLPVEQAALRYVSQNRIDTQQFTLPQFSKFQHIFCKIDPAVFSLHFDTFDEIEEQAIYLENQYWDCLSVLRNNEYDETKSYNLILMKNFILTVMREREQIRDQQSETSLNINSLGFAGTFAVKSEESLELLKRLTPLQVLELLSVPKKTEEEELAQSLIPPIEDIKF
eukprot:403361689